MMFFFFFSSRRRHTRCSRDWSSDVCSSDLFQQIGKQSSGFSDGHASLRGKGPTSFSELRLVARHLDGRESPLRTAHSARTIDRKSTRLNSSHGYISYAVFCLKKKKT